MSSITEARAQAALDSERLRQIAEWLRMDLAALPETPRPQDISTDDALIDELHSTAEWLKRTRNYTDADRVMRAVAALRRPSPPTEERPYDESTDHEYAAWDTDAIEEHAHDLLAVVRHRRAVGAAARVGGES